MGAESVTKAVGVGGRNLVIEYGYLRTTVGVSEKVSRGMGKFILTHSVFGGKLI